MKFSANLFVFLLFVINTSSASNPGSNYGCESDVNHKFYTHYTHTLSSAPNNPYWMSTFHCYDDAVTPFDPNYDPGEIPCGYVNINNFQSAGQICWIKVAGNWEQGQLKTFSAGQAVPCPIDDYLPILIVVLAITGYSYLRGKQNFNLIG